MPKRAKRSFVNRTGKIKVQTPDSKKTKDQLIKELQRLRRKSTKLQTDLKNLRSESIETKLFSELYYSVFEGIDSGVIIHTPDTKIIYCNRAAEQIFRLSRDQIMGLKAIEPGWMFTGKTGKPLKESQFPVLKVLRTGKPLKNQIFGIRSPKRKNITWLSVHAFPVFDKNGEISKVIVTSNDISKLKQAEDKLKATQKLLENKLAETELEFGNLFNLSMDLISVSSMTHFLKVNPSIKKILGYAEEEIYKIPFLDLIHPDDVEPTRRELEEKLKAGHSAIGFVNRYRHKDGSYRWLEWITMPVLEKGLLYAVARDITERRKSDEALARSEANYRDLVETSQNLIWKCDMEGRFTYLNPEWEKTHGYKMEEMLGKGFGEFQPPEIFARDMKEFARHMEGGFVKGYEIIHIGKSGNVINMLFNAFPLLDLKGNVVGTQGTATVITAQKQAQENLSQSLKDKEILLREVHHRVKNNLSVIMALLQLQANNVDDKKITALLEETRSRIMSMSLVHEKLYQTEDISTINLEDYISTLIGRIFISLDISEEIIKCKLNIQDIDLSLDVLIPLGMILNELITNSLKHAFKGDSGSISISLTASGEQKTLTYYDSGAGLPENFDIHKTDTLGLKIVFNLTKQLEGELDIMSAPGAKFSIKFNKE